MIIMIIYIMIFLPTINLYFDTISSYHYYNINKSN